MPLSGPRLARAHVDHFALDVNRVAVEHGPREAHLVPAEIADRRAERGVADRDADDEAERERAVDDARAELGVLLAILLVEMQRRGVHRERAEERVVGFGDGASQRVAEHVADLEFLEIESRHDGSRQLRVAPDIASTRNACVRCGLSSILPSSCTAPAPPARSKASTTALA